MRPNPTSRPPWRWATPKSRRSAHIALGQFARQKGDYAGAQAHLADAEDLIAGINDVLTRAVLYRELGYVHYYRGRYDDARSAFEQAGAIFANLKYQPGLAYISQALGNVALAYGQLDEAAGQYRAALKINEARGQTGNAAYSRYQLGIVAQRGQHYDDAREMYRVAGQAAGEMGDIGLQAAVQHQLASLALATGNPEQASEFNREAERLARQASDALAVTSAIYYRGLLELRAGDLEAGRRTLAQVHASFAALNSPEADKVATLLAGLGTEGGGALGGILAAAGEIDVIKDAGREVVSDDAMSGKGRLPDIDVIRGEPEAFVEAAPEIDVVIHGMVVGGKFDEL